MVDRLGGHPCKDTTQQIKGGVLVLSVVLGSLLGTCSVEIKQSGDIHLAPIGATLLCLNANTRVEQEAGGILHTKRANTTVINMQNTEARGDAGITDQSEVCCRTLPLMKIEAVVAPRQ